MRFSSQESQTRLIGVVVPVAAAWLEHLIDYNLSQVQQSIDEAEQYLAAGQPAVTIGEVVGQLHGMLNPGQAESESARPTTKTLRIGDLSAKEIEQAGADGQTIAVTHERELIAIVTDAVGFCRLVANRATPGRLDLHTTGDPECAAMVLAAASTLALD